MEMLATSSRKLGWSVSIAKDADQAYEIFHSRNHELVIIDRRGQRASEADNICRVLKNSPSYSQSVCLALVKKSSFINADKDDILTLKLLEVGYTRALMESSYEGIFINELLGIYNSSVLPKIQLSASHALYLALDRCRNMVHVTDHENIIQFVNKVTTKLLGYKSEEIMGTDLTNIMYYENSSLMEQQLNRGREFEGAITCKRKNNESITVNCRIIPFCINLMHPTHYIYVYDTIGESGSHSNQISPMHTNQKSLPRKSSDTRFSIIEGRRRSSLQNLQLEAPITKVITLLTNAVESAVNPEMATSVTKAIDILKTTELYSPQLKDDKGYSDPVATDLVGALLSSPRTAWDSRRSSTDSVRLSSSKILFSPTGGRLQPKGLRASNDIVEILDKSLEWEFEIFKLERLTEKRPLLFLGTNIMNYYRVPARLGIDEKILQNWLAVIESNYRSENSYHNSTHAADVLQATAKFMQSDRLKQILEPLDEVVALIAAAAHDIDHPGRSNQFLCNADNKLAILYNDLSVLESHHAALTFKISLADEKANIFQNLERETYKLIRHNVIDMILATEMTKHFEHLAKFMNICSARIGSMASECFIDFQAPTDSMIDMSVLQQPDNVLLVKRMMIKCADVSNPTRPLKSCIEWARRIAEEYFCQTDEEKVLKIPVVMPMFDRATCSIPKSQIGFVDFIINDMIEAWDAFINMPEMVGYMKHNYEKWQIYNEQGITTLQDIKKLQELPELQVP
ncbi:high affinity cAMP-specific and IBMX-insensitive 3',5'-cyclic phosphodiesterase 8 isoform X2 [Prorops nasuta]|uniref:high affinity cAMP-specific and IBMX-insensitive 3',5'-cyclic phosphodiesterase 8 isoform X2 n=1 Tax=Prorops nasuta TaxID=863751 RepID=UPI0034CF71D3